MMEQETSEESEHLRAANKPNELALAYHARYTGKIEVCLKAPVTSYHDFAIWYTPGVAEPSRAIHKSPERVYEYTNKGNFVAIVTDGTRVLGLGDVGPEAALPVMEGKAMLFKYLGGVDAFPLCLATKDPEEIIKIVKAIAPTFGGINLEDIESPKCYELLDRLRAELRMPVWHDDQQGTALVILAGLLNALKVVGKRLDEVSCTLIGAGAANINVAKYLHLAGARWEKMIMVDSRGILSPARVDLQGEPKKWAICEKTNREGRSGGIPEAMRDTDVCIALSTPGPGVIRKEWVARMADEAIVFAAANPVPEIWPWEAEEAGARIVATGRSDFPNQINNSLGFPAVFRGALDVRATGITDEMCIAAAYAIAGYAEEQGLSAAAIIPTMDEREMYVREAVAVGTKAIEQGIAQRALTAPALEEVVRAKLLGATSKTF
jgi:malate dehydrogenase (oxaloacetate-decarboxylating)